MMQESNPHTPFAYFITLTTYGTWLHGDTRGSVDRWHHEFGMPRIKPNKNLYACMQKEKQGKAIMFDEYQRKIVMNAIRSACKHYHWHLYAIHVRSNHAHLIVAANLVPEKIMNQLKAYASRALNKLLRQSSPQKYWARHGSTRYIWSKQFLFPAMHYVIDQQGSRMACYYESWYEESLMLRAP
jgi:REP element-mobilizing transposase RayT